jgi:hypothetical protein
MRTDLNQPNIAVKYRIEIPGVIQPESDPQKRDCQIVATVGRLSPHSAPPIERPMAAAYRPPHSNLAPAMAAAGRHVSTRRATGAVEVVHDHRGFPDGPNAIRRTVQVHNIAQTAMCWTLAIRRLRQSYAPS